MGEYTEQLVRTDMVCTNCSKNFIAQLDLGLDGDHVVECPYCWHEHCRTIKSGVVTEARWSSRGNRSPNTIMVDRGSVWKSEHEPIVTSMASAFIRDRWLNRSDVQL